MGARRVLSSCLLHASHGQTWRPRASTNQSLPSRLSQSLVCVFLSLEQARSHLCHGGSACSFVLFAPRISRTNVAPSSKHEPVFTMSVESKCCVFFFLTPEQSRSHLCHVRSVCSSHLLYSTNLADKRGALEQARPSLHHVGSVKVFCETSGVSWQLARFWKLASETSPIYELYQFIVRSDIA